MPTLVHIANEKNAAAIKRAGIAPGKALKVVFFMPVVRSHFVSHQWLRELKRGGAKVMVGVYFRLPSSEIVWAGRYNEKHEQLPLGQAIKNLMSRNDPLGYEIFVERKIHADEITRIRQLSQNIGWRYQPDAHGKVPCPCPRCIRGAYGAQRIRDKFEPMPAREPYALRKAAITFSNDMDEITSALWSMCDKRRIADPSFMERLLNFDNDDLQRELANALSCFKHPKSKQILLGLLEHKNDDVREAAQEALHELYPREFANPHPDD
jgi:hypothetical protein